MSPLVLPGSAAAPHLAPDGAWRDAMLTLLRVEGMMCGHCTSSVETALRAVPEVREVSVDLESKLARVDGSASAEALIEAVQSVGHASELVPGTVLRVEGMSNDRRA